MVVRVKEERTCDAPGKHDGEVKPAELIIDGRLYKPDWCEKHRAQAKALLGKVKPARRGRSRMVPVDPDEIPRIGVGS